MKLYVTQKYLNEKFQTYSDALKNVFDLNADFQIVDLYSTITNNIVNYTQDILFYVTTSETDTNTNVTYDSGFYFYSNTTKIVTPFNMNSGTAIYIQSTAPSDTTGLWIDNTDPAAVDMKLYDEIVSDWYSLNNMNYSNVIIISKNEYDVIPEDERKAGYYYLVYDDEGIIDDLTGGIIIYEFDETNTTRSYAKGSYVVYGTCMYRCIVETSTAGTFDETEWEVIGGSSSDGINIKEFDVNVEYQANEYVVYNNTIYKANTITTNATTGTFVETEWDLVGGSGKSNDSNVIVISKADFDDLSEEERNNGYYLVYDATSTGGGTTENKSDNILIIYKYDETKEYTEGMYIVNDSGIYKCIVATSTIGPFVESEWKSIGGTGDISKANVVAISQENYDLLTDDEKNDTKYFYLIYDADGNIIIDSSSNAIKIKDFDSTISYVADECVVYNNKLYRAATTTSAGSFVEEEWEAIAGSDYDKLTNLPSINGVVIRRNITLTDLDIPEKEEVMMKTDYSSDVNKGYVKAADKAKTIDGSELAKPYQFFGIDSSGNAKYQYLPIKNESEIYHGCFEQREFVNVTAGDVFQIESVNPLDDAKTIIQAYKQVQGDQDETITLKKHIIGQQDNFYYNSENVEFTNDGCSIKTKYKIKTNIPKDGYFISDSINIDEYIK